MTRGILRRHGEALTELKLTHSLECIEMLLAAWNLAAT
jgi:hypothetical protein